MSGNGEKRAGEDGAVGPRARTGSGVGEAAFPVGVLAGAAVGGVGGALVGDETAAASDKARASDERRGRASSETGKARD